MIYSYACALNEHPEIAGAIETLSKHPIAHWYTDRDPFAKKNLDAYLNSNEDCQEANDSVLQSNIVVVYGLPSKDCKDHFSSDGCNKSTDDYKRFIQVLKETNRSNKRTIYILEPDAIGLLMDPDGVAQGLQYEKNLRMAIKMLSFGDSLGETYIDIGFWCLMSDEQAAKVAKLVHSMDKHRKCKGIALNTSNYRSNEEMNALCERFCRASKRKYSCIVDTSRNYIGPPASGEWCNVKHAGIGVPPTKNTGYEYIDYFVWVKPPGESDGEGTNRSSDAMLGPTAGQFFYEHFVILWNKGFFVCEKGACEIKTD